MAQFTNQAQLSYNNTVVNSNVATGEILEVLSAVKTAVVADYTRSDDITYVISAVNSGNTALTGISISDDLGGYAFGANTVYPLNYTDGSVKLYINGVLQGAPAVSAGPPLVFSGITIPANSSMVLVYRTELTQFAPLDTSSTIVNTATLNGAGIPTPITASESVTPAQAPELTITKSIDPSVVTENSPITYTFVIQNYGNTPAIATDNVTVTDTFDPVLSNLAVTLDGTAWTDGTEYTYNAASGVFASTPGAITVPAATYTQDPATGTYVINPGISVLTITGTI